MNQWMYGQPVDLKQVQAQLEGVLRDDREDDPLPPVLPGCGFMEF